MSDKCSAHDACIGRIHDTLDEIRDEFRKTHDDIRNEIRSTHLEIKDMLHNGSLVHANHEMRISQMESRGIDMKTRFVNLCFGLLEKGIIAIIIAAWWAHNNGFGQ